MARQVLGGRSRALLEGAVIPWSQPSVAWTLPFPIHGPRPEPGTITATAAEGCAPRSGRCELRPCWTGHEGGGTAGCVAAPDPSEAPATSSLVLEEQWPPTGCPGPPATPLCRVGSPAPGDAVRAAGCLADLGCPELWVGVQSPVATPHPVRTCDLQPRTRRPELPGQLQAGGAMPYLGPLQVPAMCWGCPLYGTWAPLTALVGRHGHLGPRRAVLPIKTPSSPEPPRNQLQT